MNYSHAQVCNLVVICKLDSIEADCRGGGGERGGGRGEGGKGGEETSSKRQETSLVPDKRTKELNPYGRCPWLNDQ